MPNGRHFHVSEYYRSPEQHHDLLRNYWTIARNAPFLWRIPSPTYELPGNCSSQWCASCQIWPRSEKVNLSNDICTWKRRERSELRLLGFRITFWFVEKFHFFLNACKIHISLARKFKLPKKMLLAPKFKLPKKLSEWRENSNSLGQWFCAKLQIRKK